MNIKSILFATLAVLLPLSACMTDEDAAEGALLVDTDEDPEVEAALDADALDPVEDRDLALAETQELGDAVAKSSPRAAGPCGFVRRVGSLPRWNNCTSRAQLIRVDLALLPDQNRCIPAGVSRAIGTQARGARLLGGC